MTTCALTFDIGSGPDIAAARGFVEVSRVARGSNGDFLVIATEKPVVLTYPFNVISSFQQGAIYRFRELLPTGVQRVCEIPATSTANYSELIDLEPVPGGSGAFLVVPNVYISTDGEEPTGMSVGDYWYVDNPSLPTDGDLNQYTGA